MQRFLYRSNEKQIVLLDTLEILELDELAAFIFEGHLSEDSIEKIINDYKSKYEISYDEAREHVEDLSEEFQSLGLLKNNEYVIDDMMLHTPIVHIIQNCNSPCTMCDCWQTKGRKWFSRAQLRPLFKELSLKGAIGIMVSGGEPLMHPELDGILEDIKSFGLEIYLNTNGILLNKKLDILKKHQVEEVVLSMDGVDAQSYQLVRGSNQFERVVKNIKELRQTLPQTRIILRTTLTKNILLRLDELTKLANDLGIDHIGFSPLDISSDSFSRSQMDDIQSQDISDRLLPNYQEISKFLMLMQSYKIQKLFESGFISWGEEKFKKCMEFYLSLLNGRENLYSEKMCTFPYNSLVVDYDGSIKSCFYSKAFGNIDEVDKIDWNFQKRTKELVESKKCQTCRGNVFCGV